MKINFLPLHLELLFLLFICVHWSSNVRYKSCKNYDSDDYKSNCFKGYNILLFGLAMSSNTCYMVPGSVLTRSCLRLPPWKSLKCNGILFSATILTHIWPFISKSKWVTVVNYVLTHKYKGLGCHYCLLNNAFDASVIHSWADIIDLLLVSNLSIIHI